MRPILFVAATIAAASVLTTAGAMAQCSTTAIPLPKPALLTPPSEFNCEFKTATLNDATGQLQPSAPRAQTDPGADAAAQNMELDRERQCYRHARMILRDGLLQLQASVDETMKAVKRACPTASTGPATAPGSRTSIPLPSRALLTPPPDFNCEFKGDEAAGATQPSPTRAQADAALRMKLDYERQCYRHNEMILRTGLRQLQVSVGETIKAVDRNEQPAARQQRPDDGRLSSVQESPCAGFSLGRCIGRDPDRRIRFMIRHDASQ